MIRPPGFAGAAFGDAGDGDGRRDAAARRTMAAALGISDRWAYVSQVHGPVAVRATGPGSLGEADAVFSSVSGLPMTVATADCLPIVVEGPDIAGVVHAGWRGLAAGIIGSTLEAIEAAGLTVSRAAIGASIGPCCYAVGEEVAARFDGHTGHTRDGRRSVDLAGVAVAELGGLVSWRSGDCTSCGGDWHSYRRDGTALRQVAIAWLPAD